MDRSKVTFIFIILILFTSIASANNENIIFLKAGHIDTGPETAVNDSEPDRAIHIDTELPDNSDKYYLVQFDGIILPEWKDAVESTGAEILSYVPDNSFVLKMNLTVRSAVESLEFVRWTGEYLPEYKYVEEPSLSTSSIDFESSELVDMVVFLFESDEDDRVKSEILVLGGVIADESDEMLWIQITEDKINELAFISGISWIDRAQELTASNDVASEIINVDTVHSELTLKGNGQIVAVSDIGLDTGIESSVHADIRDRILNITDYSNDGPEDTTGHGTHVTGSVLGDGTLSGGQYAGMAPEAELVFQAIGTDSGGIVALNSNIYTVFQDAYNADARIHTNSWGSDTDGLYEGYSYYVDKFAWEHPDMLILFSVGNEGEDIDDDGVVDKDSIHSPATAKNCLSVGASETDRGDTFTTNSYTTWNSFDSIAFPTNPIKTDYMGDDSNGIAAFSSRGPTDDGRIKPDIVAPGTFIISTQASMGWYDWDTFSTGDHYAYNSGTSMATPIVAGSAVLVREFYTGIENVANPSAALLKATLINGAYDLTPGQYGEGVDQEVEGRPDYSQGWGRLDVENSIMADYPKVIAYYDDESLSTGESWTHTYDYIESGGPLRATLVWTDYPGQVYSNKTLVNDLDLSIIGPSNIYYGNNGPDHTNNVEGIELSSLTEGSYTIDVTGYNVNVNHAPQPFALVSSFICDNNEFPAPDTQADIRKTAVSTDVVHPQGVDINSIVMKINDVPVTFDSVAVTDGYAIEHNSASAYQTGGYNVSVTASTENGQEFSYSWNFTVDAEAANIVPVLDNIGDREVSESYPLTIELSADDDDGDTLSFDTNASFGSLSGTTFTWTPDYDDSGTYDVEFNVSDGFDVDSEIITINVVNVNRAPSLATIGSHIINENESISFTISATDADDDTLSFDTNASFGSLSGTTFTWKPDYEDSGIYYVEFNVSDGIDVDSEMITINVINVDRKPELAAIGDKTTNEDQLLTFTISASDADNDTVTYSANNLPVSASLETDSGEFSWIPLYNESGTYDVEFIASANGVDVSETITITVVNVDRKPELEGIGNKEVNESEFLSFTISAIDPDEEPSTMVYSAQDLPLGANLDPNTGEFTWTPGYDDSKAYNVEFIASSNGLKDSETIMITVNNVDRKPQLDTIGNQEVDEDELLTFTISATDPDGDNVVYSSSNNPSGSTLDPASGVFIWTPNYSDSGSHSVEFIASSNDLNDSETITITVNDVDRPVELDPIDDRTVNESDIISFTVIGIDPDGDDVIYSVSGMPSQASFDNSTGEFNWITGFNDSGTHNIEFTAIANSSTDSELVIITVMNVDRAPELTFIGNKTVNENESISFTISATDSDGDAVTYSASSLPKGCAFDAATGTFEWTTEYSDAGSYDVMFSATSNGLVDNENVSISVLDVNAPPEFNTVSSQIVIINSNLQFTLNATDIDNNPLVYSVDTLPVGAQFNVTSLLFNWTPATNQTGTHYANFTVTDSQYYDHLNVSIEVTDSSTSSDTITPSSGGGGGGGGGGGTTGEEFENIAVKDVSSIFVGTGPVKFEFYRDGNDIQYVSYESLKNAGTISVTIEVLVDRSTFVSSLPSGVVYRNINIWVGKTGYAIEENIDDPFIGFRVDRNWIENNNIDPDSIALNRYDSGWNRLSTRQTDSDADYLYFEASTPGFSPFAITGESQVTESRLNAVEDTQFSTDEEDLESNVTLEENEPEKTLNALSGLISFLILTLVCFLNRKQ